MAEDAEVLNNSETQKYTSSSPKNSNLTKFFDYIWPIKRHELPKFLLITLLMFCILGIQNLIRAQKDSIINTMIGTETIAFLKFYGVLPAAFLVTIIYVKLVNIMKGEHIFYCVMSFFLIFFALFAFYIFPNHETLHLNKIKVNDLILTYPNFKWFILLLSNWSFSLFYIMAELWPNAVFALLFWQFVNKITSIEESKRFYLHFGLIGQTGLIISGLFLQKLPEINAYFTHKFNLAIPETILSVQLVLGIVSVLGLIGLLAFWLINYKVIDIETIETIEYKVKKTQMSLLESIKMILSSRYIMLITILLVCYGISINLVEGPWKKAASAIYSNPTEYNAFVGSYLSYTGIFTISFVLIGSNIVRKLGWFAAAIITPLMVFTTGFIFFLVTNFKATSFAIIGMFIVLDPALIGITIGAVQNVLSKSSKYTLFDSTKEMTYVPLDNELKTKGKAAADIMGTKLGKSASALLQSLIFIIFPNATYHSISVYLMIIFTIICLIWIWGVKQLNNEYEIASKKNELKIS